MRTGKPMSDEEWAKHNDDLQQQVTVKAANAFVEQVIHMATGHDNNEWAVDGLTLLLEAVSRQESLAEVRQFAEDLQETIFKQSVTYSQAVSKWKVDVCRRERWMRGVEAA